MGTVHLFDWDEINFAEAAREMLVTGNFLEVQIDFQTFFEKPPFFFWLQALSMKLFGVSEYAARLPNAVAGMLSLLLVFQIGKRLYNAHFAWLWVMTYMGSILPQLYFHSGIIDPWFNLFIFASLYYFLLFYWRMEGYKGTKTFKGPYFFFGGSALFMGMAILTKGPAAFIILCLCLGVYWILQGLRFYVSIPQFLAYTLAVLVVPILWFGAGIIVNGTEFIQEFIVYQYRLFSTEDAGHGGFFGYHFVVLLIGCFPASIFALRSFFKQEQELPIQVNFKRWMLILFWVVLILFSIVQSKIVHYSSLAYFPLTYLATLYIYQIIQAKSVFPAWVKYSLLTLGILLSLVVISVPFIGQNPEILAPLFSKDPFAQANLTAEVVWHGWESIAGFILLGGVLGGVYFFNYHQTRKGVYVLFTGTAIFVTTTLYLYINNIEGYSQRAAIDFYKNVPENSYVLPYGYKSYAHLFYTKKTPQFFQDAHQIMTDEAVKEVYIVTKINKVEQFLMTYSNYKEIGRENGFIFFKKVVGGEHERQ